MPQLIESPAVVEAAGNRPKRIEEFVGRVNTGTESASVALMKSPPGWIEPGQKPEFDEFTLVIKGALQVRSKEGTLVVQANQAVIVHAGEWIQYSTPTGAEYVAVCVPAFSPETVHRDE